MKEQKQVLINASLLVIVIALIGIGFYSASMLIDAKADNISVYTDTAPEKQTLNASGNIVKYVSPDKVEISLSVETLEESAKDSQTENSIVSDKVIADLKAAGVPEAQIKTTGYSVYEERSWNKDTQDYDLKGYRTRNTILVTLYDTSKAGEIVDTAVNAGVNKISGITFGLTETKELEIRKNALTEAAEVATSKAESIADGLNLSIKKVVSVSESGYYYTPNYRSYDMMESSAVGVDSAPTTQIIAGDVEVTATVSVVFEVE